jgi:DNA-binding NtrC family response regulator
MDKLEDIVPSLAKLNILIVEDGEDIRNIMLATFNKLFKNVAIAVDGEEGLAKFQENRPDIIISDIRMPNMSGNEMIEKIKELDSSIPVIVVSGHGKIIKATNKADVRFEKPIKFDKLVNAIYELTR